MRGVEACVVRPQLFEGPAGSGKTHALLNAVEGLVGQNSLRIDQRVLGLTFMHGARRRVADRLRALVKLGGRFDTMTVDSFARHVVVRWQSLARSLGLPPLPTDSTEADGFETVSEVALQLVRRGEVLGWVAATYPILIVDEMQDCRGSRFEIIRCLSSRMRLLAAADEFQDLRELSVNPTITWLRSNSDVTPFSGNQRTHVVGLLAAARALREGFTVQKGTGFSLLAAPNYHVAALFLARSFGWWGLHDTVILTPAKQETAPFVKDVLAKLRSERIQDRKYGRALGPFRIRSEPSHEEDATALVQQIEGMDVTASHDELVQTVRKISAPVACALRGWLSTQRRVAGRNVIPVSELQQQVRRLYQHVRAHTVDHQGMARIMTIHQAKNREFSRVIVLWPYQVVGDQELGRRLLYNAITRAKSACLVVVQDGNKGARLGHPPFRGVSAQ